MDLSTVLPGDDGSRSLTLGEAILPEISLWVTFQDLDVFSDGHFLKTCSPVEVTHIEDSQAWFCIQDMLFWVTAGFCKDWVSTAGFLL